MPEIHDLLTTLCTTSANIIILGDFNIHVDTPSCHLAAEFLHLLDCLNLTQYVVVPTHTRGHTLDLVITNYTLISNLLVFDLGVSDHKAISMELPILYPLDKPKRQISFRNTVTDSVNFYNASLSSLLDLHAPVKTGTVTFTLLAPWYTSDLGEMKKAGRVLERRFKVSGLTVHKFGNIRRPTQNPSVMHGLVSSPISSKIALETPKDFFSTVNNLLKPQTP